MYIDSNIDSSFNRIAEINEKYVILVKEFTLDNNHTYNAYIQFFNPSSDYYYITNYKPKIENASNTDLNYYYNWGNGLQYIDHVEMIYSQNTSPVDVDSNFFSRPDYMNIIIGISAIIISACIIVNAVTSIIIKGGLFNND